MPVPIHLYRSSFQLKIPSANRHTAELIGLVALFIEEWRLFIVVVDKVIGDQNDAKP